MKKSSVLKKTVYIDMSDKKLSHEKYQGSFEVSVLRKILQKNGNCFVRHFI